MQEFSIFTEAESLLDTRLNKINIELIDAITSYTELCEDYHFTEATENFIIKIKKFIANMISSISHFMDSIKLEINARMRAADYQNNLRLLQKKLKAEKANGKTKVKVQDVWAVKDVYLEAVKKLNSYAKRLSKMEYKDTLKLDSDLEEFFNLYDEYETKIEATFKKEKVVDIEEMIKFLDKECSGNSSMMKSIENSMVEFKEIGNDANALAKKYDILGPDIIQKHVGCIRKVLMKISAFIKRFIVKFIVACCILIG